MSYHPTRPVTLGKSFNLFWPQFCQLWNESGNRWFAKVPSSSKYVCNGFCLLKWATVNIFIEENSLIWVLNEEKWERNRKDEYKSNALIQVMVYKSHWKDFNINERTQKVIHDFGMYKVTIVCSAQAGIQV